MNVGKCPPPHRMIWKTTHLSNARPRSRAPRICPAASPPPLAPSGSIQKICLLCACEYGLFFLCPWEVPWVCEKGAVAYVCCSVRLFPLFLYIYIYIYTYIYVYTQYRIVGYFRLFYNILLHFILFYAILKKNSLK